MQSFWGAMPETPTALIKDVILGLAPPSSILTPLLKIFLDPPLLAQCLCKTIMVVCINDYLRLQDT